MYPTALDWQVLANQQARQIAEPALQAMATRQYQDGQARLIADQNRARMEQLAWAQDQEIKAREWEQEQQTRARAHLLAPFLKANGIDPARATEAEVAEASRQANVMRAGQLMSRINQSMAVPEDTLLKEAMVNLPDEDRNGIIKAINALTELEKGSGNQSSLRDKLATLGMDPKAKKIQAAVQLTLSMYNQLEADHLATAQQSVAPLWEGLYELYYRDPAAFYQGTGSADPEQLKVAALQDVSGGGSDGADSDKPSDMDESFGGSEPPPDTEDLYPEGFDYNPNNLTNAVNSMDQVIPAALGAIDRMAGKVYNFGRKHLTGMNNPNQKLSETGFGQNYPQWMDAMFGWARAPQGRIEVPGAPTPTWARPQSPLLFQPPATPSEADVLRSRYLDLAPNPYMRSNAEVIRQGMQRAPVPALEGPLP